MNKKILNKTFLMGGDLKINRIGLEPCVSPDLKSGGCRKIHRIQLIFFAVLLN
jgi:hypothetical protein